MRDGMNNEDARREALVEVGGVEQVKEEVRASRTGSNFESFLIDAATPTRCTIHFK